MAQRKKYKSFDKNSSLESEDRLAANMEAGGAVCVTRHNATSAFDQRYLVNGELVTVELKCETAQNTGNLFFETAQGNPPKPSGVMISVSSVTVHEVASSYEVFRTDDLRQYVSDCARFPWVSRRCGDNHNVGVLRPIGIMQYPWHRSCDKPQVAIAVASVLGKTA